MKGDCYRIFLAGDVMTGRGIDQILRHPSNPRIYESYVTDARDYVQLAEQINGKIPRKTPPSYIWGDALEIWNHYKPDIKIINLETAITVNEKAWPGKGIHYRMHPDNIDTLQTAGFDICTLANNHVLDWGTEGFIDTLSALRSVHIKISGAGNNDQEASSPAIYEFPDQSRILVFAAGLQSSGVNPAWSAGAENPGVAYLSDLGSQTRSGISHLIAKYYRPGDLLVFSIHWGSNWGYEVPDEHREFAHYLIDLGFDLIFGHSSHHPRPIEIYRNKPILYGCGDFINDYEGIQSNLKYRSDLPLMFFVEFEPKTLHFQKIILIPLQIKKFRLQLAEVEDSQWQFQIMKKISSHSHFVMPSNHEIICHA